MWDSGFGYVLCILAFFAIIMLLIAALLPKEDRAAFFLRALGMLMMGMAAICSMGVAVVLLKWLRG